MTKEQAIERLKKMIQINNGVIKEARKNGDIFAMQLTADLDTDSIAIEKVLTMLEEKDKQISLYIDNIMTHQQVKTIRKMCCTDCQIKACTYSGIHRDCIKQYFENKAKETEGYK